MNTTEARNPELRHAMFRVGDWLVDARANRIERGDDVKTLRNKAMELLVLLANQAGQVVLRDEIVERIWEGNEYVATKGITNTIWTLRQSLGDTADTPQYIETIAKRGYRLLAPVVAIPMPTTFAALPASPDNVGSINTTMTDTVADAPSEFSLHDDTVPTTGQREQSLPHASIANADNEKARTKKVREKIWRSYASVFAVAMVSVAAVFAVSAWWRSAPIAVAAESVPIASTADVRVLQVTPEVEHPLALAPDGKRYAYASRLYKYQANTLWLRTLAADAEPVQLKQYPGYIYALAWSPDGQELAVLTANANRQCEVTVLSLRSLQSRSLGSCSDHPQVAVSWSADGRYLAASVATETGAVAVALIDPITGVRNMLTTPAPGQADVVGDFAPHDSSLLVQRWASLSELELWQVALDGSAQLRWRGEDRIFDSVMDWYRPNEVLLSLAREGGETQLQVLSLADGQLKPLGITGTSPQALADGSVLFVRSSSHYAISEVDLQQRPLRAQSLVRQNGLLSQPAYRDRDHFVFMGNLTGHMEIFAGDRDGRSQQLTQLQRMAWDPAVSPDGRWLAFAGQCGGDNLGKICLQEMASGRVSVLFSGEHSAEAPRWSADGRQLLFRMKANDREMKVGRLAVDAGVAGPVEWLAQLPSIDVRLSEDGRSLFWVDRYRPGIWQRDIASGSDQLRVAEFPGGSRVWTSHGDALIYLIRQADRQLQVYRQRPSQAVESLGAIPHLLLDAQGSLAVSPDGQRLLLPELTTFAWDVALAEVPTLSTGAGSLLGQRRLLSAR